MLVASVLYVPKLKENIYVDDAEEEMVKWVQDLLTPSQVLEGKKCTVVKKAV